MTDAMTKAERTGTLPGRVTPRMLGRIALLLIIVGSVAIKLQEPQAGGGRRQDQPNGSFLYITLQEGEGYGRALGEVGTKPSASIPVGDARFSRALTQALGTADSPIVVRVSGGVRQEALERVRSLLLQACEKRQIPVTLWRWEKALREPASETGP